jgi:hypothetical protein
MGESCPARFKGDGEMGRWGDGEMERWGEVLLQMNLTENDAEAIVIIFEQQT